MFPDDKLDSTYKNNTRTRLILIVAAISIIPMALDGFSQMLTDYESTAFMRLITGTPFGIFVGAFLASSLSARPLFFSKDPSRVVLPSGSRFTLSAEEE
tara:strand:- start:1188 stop:1484 length:297 start_codon:yes stop_codon:yes gene_type:complete